MTNLLYYKRNRATNVEQLDDRTMITSCRLMDTLTEGFVELKVRLPDLEIIEAKGEFMRTYDKRCVDVKKALQKVVNVRIGPGMLKIIKGLMGESTDCKELIFMVEECCHGIILTFTKDTLRSSPKDKKDVREYYRNMVKENIRMYNRCAAFAPGSPLVEGIDPPH